MKRTVFLFIAAFSCLLLHSQTGSITNIQVSQRSDDSYLMDVYFNLSGPGNAYDIGIEISFDAGVTYTEVLSTFLSGDVNSITPGSNKHIVIDGWSFLPNYYSSQAKVKIIAEEISGGIPCPGMATFTDPRDGQTYNTVQIGNQCWMKENLMYLPSVTRPENGSSTAPYYYVYGYHGYDVNTAKASVYFQNYGVLYNRPASLNACPSGWHLPDDGAWTQLTNYLVSQGFPTSNVTNGAGNALKSCRQANSPLGGDCNTTAHPRWASNSIHHGFDEFGFAAYAGGSRSTNGRFYDLGFWGHWWSSSINPSVSGTSIWIRYIINNNGDVGRISWAPSLGLSVRCILD